MVDDVDRRIIEILQKDSRIPNTEIAKKLDISEASVRNRIKDLVEEGIIRKFTVETEPSRLGYDSVALVGVDVEPEKFLSAANELSEFEEVKEVFLTTGDHMIMMEIWAKTGEQLTEILSEKVGKVNGAERICPAVILEKIKDGY